MAGEAAAHRDRSGSLPEQDIEPKRRLQRLADLVSAQMSDHGRPVNMCFVGDNDASVRDLSRKPTVGINERQASLALQSPHSLYGEAKQT